MYGCCEIEIWAGAEHAVSKDVVRPIKRDLHARDGSHIRVTARGGQAGGAILRGCGGGGSVRAGGLLGQAVAAKAATRTERRVQKSLAVHVPSF